jgi:hypothetical protein
MQIRKRVMKLKKKIFSEITQPNFAELIFGWSPFKIVSVSAILYPRWPPLLNYFFFKWPKLLYFKQESAQI